jgi:D-arabinose 1-dehydrogenase-like Zn-dependent alcohol dehydrogenase
MSDMRLFPFTPAAIETMLDSASRHNVAPQTEPSPISDINNVFA